MTTKANKFLVQIASALEILAGISWIIAPGLIVPNVIGGELVGAGVGLGRVAGMGLVSLGLACWPWPDVTRSAVCALLTYNALITAYFAYVVVRWGMVGKMLAPSLIIHGLLMLLLVVAWLGIQKRHEQEVAATIT